MVSSAPIATKTKDKVVLPKRLEGLTAVKYTICGSDHCFAITADSQVFGWGSNGNGRLGINTRRFEEAKLTENIWSVYVPFPLQIDALSGKKIDCITTESDHSLALCSETGDVYAWGSGVNGKLGYGGVENIKEPTIIEGFKIASEYGMKVKEIACGESHTLAIVEENSEGSKKQRIFVWGYGKNWQLGLSSDLTESMHEPHQLDPDPFDGEVLHVFAAHNYSCAISQKGEIFTWGSGEFGRLGYNTETKQQQVPKQIKSMAEIKVVTVALGAFHAGAITSTGAVYTWGKGLAGQLGHEEVKSEDSPKPVKALADKKIIQICCGENHSIALSMTGEVYTWGAGQQGQLGHGDLVKRNVPTKVEELREKKITQISAGKKHSAALTNEGYIYLWGGNEYCQLGMSSSTPTAVSTSKKIAGPLLAEAAFSDFTTNPKPFISQNNSPKENHLSQNLLEAEIKNYTFNLSNINTLQSVNVSTLVGTFGKPIGWDSNDKASRLDAKERKPLENDHDNSDEKKFLMQRIKQLELNNDVAMYKYNQQKIYEVMNVYCRLLDQEFASSPGDSLQTIIQKNAKIDSVAKHFRQKILEFKDDLVTVNFCIQMFERFCDLRRKANYAVS